MKGQTCGLCGKADGETKQEYRTPSGYLTESSVSFAHSWVLPAESCRDASRKICLAMFITHMLNVTDVVYIRNLFPPSECRMKLESVKLEKQVVLDGQQSKCYSVEPVLRCLPGCAPLRTIPVTVGYHCLPTGK